MVTEFPADHVGLEMDAVCFYPVMPFGRNGSPPHFARFGDAITKAHRHFGQNLPNTLLMHSARSMLYVEDGISPTSASRRGSALLPNVGGRLTLWVIGSEASG